jgi:anaerobic selenocysteine-containing dehydrogenase
MPELDVRNREPSKSQKQSDGLTRRNFLKTTAVAAGAVALGSSSGCGSISSGNSAVPSTDEQYFYSGCRFMGCQKCSGKIVVRDGIVVRVETDPNDPRQFRPCLRGRAQIQRLYNPKRLKYPMKRVGERGSGEWEQITWEEALTTITDKWQSYMKEFGPTSIGHAGGSAGGGYLQGTCAISLTTRLRNVLGWTNVAGCADLASPTGINKVTGPKGNVYGWPSMGPADVKNSKVAFCWSDNRSNAHSQEYYYLMKAKENGTKLVVIDPILTALASKADLWVHPRPGSDTILMLSMINVIVSEGWEDNEFVMSKTCAPILVRDDTGQFLRMSDLGVAPQAGPVDPTTGQPTVIDPTVVWDKATNSHATLGAAIEPAREGSFTINGIQVRTAWDLLMDEVHLWPPDKACEQCDVDVATIRELARLSSLEKPVHHYQTYGSQAYDNGVAVGHALATLIAITGDIGFLGSGFGSGGPSAPFNIMFYMPTMKISNEIPVYALYDLLKTGKYKGADYPMKSLFIVGCGFLSGSTDMNRVKREMIDLLEFIVVADVAFNDTVLYADIILPAGHPYESEDVFSAAGFWIHNEKVCDPLYECVSDGDMARLFAERLGVSEYFSKTDTEFFEEIFDNDTLRSFDITASSIKKQHAMRYFPEGEVVNAECIYPTSTKRLEFYCESPVPRIDFGQSFDVDFERLPRFRPPKEAWPTLDIMKKYPFVLISERPRDRVHSMGYQDTWILEIEPEPSFKINPTDAERYSIREGEYIEVFNDRGHAVAIAHISSGIRPGTLLYPKGWQNTDFKAGNWSELTSSDYDPVAINGSFFDVAVGIRKWEVA